MTLTKAFPPPTGAAVLGATFSLIAFAAVIIATRFFYRLRIQREMLVTSDWFMILALCAAISCAAFDVVFYSLDVLRPRISVGFENYNPGEEKVEYIYKIFPAFMGRRRKTLWITVFYCGLAYAATLCMQLFSCMPIERHWVITQPLTACDWRWQGIVFQVSWALSFLGSLLILILPFTVVHDLDLTKRAKLGLYFVSLVGLLDIAISLVRFLNVELGDNGSFRSFSTIELWSSLDVNIGLITACLPSLRMLLGRTRRIDDYTFDEAKTARSSRAMEHRELEEIEESTYLGVNSVGPSNRSNRVSQNGDKTPERKPEPERSWKDDDGDDTDFELDNINVEALTKDQAQSYWSTP
uniref:Rhodopsin domain-containing protein n=1 Tax=Fusarium oxysporum (strain Fo5176) TaxID=660025 RepID=A0A0D2XZV9_FUSOF